MTFSLLLISYGLYTMELLPMPLLLSNVVLVALLHYFSCNFKACKANFAILKMYVYHLHSLIYHMKYISIDLKFKYKNTSYYSVFSFLSLLAFCPLCIMWLYYVWCRPPCRDTHTILEELNWKCENLNKQWTDVALFSRLDNCPAAPVKALVLYHYWCWHMVVKGGNYMCLCDRNIVHTIFAAYYQIINE